LLAFLITASCATPIPVVSSPVQISPIGTGTQQDPPSLILPAVGTTNQPTAEPTIIPAPVLPEDDNALFYTIKWGDTLEKIAAKTGLSTEDILKFNDSEMVRRMRPDTKLALFDRESILQRIYSEPGKKIVVIVGYQMGYALDGATPVHIPFIISTGIDAHPSHIGKFAIITKLKSMVMRGQSDIKGRMYNIPDVPFDMNFYSVFYIHGAYWHNAFGHKHSGGCINFRTPDAEWLYNWSDPLPIGNMTWATQSNPGTTVWVIP